MSETEIAVRGSSRIEDVLRQVRAIKSFPTSIHIYDRIFSLDNEGEKDSLVHGLEIGWFLCEDNKDREKLIHQ